MTRLKPLFLWAGGGMFVLSLAVCAYSYVVRWAAPPEANRFSPANAITIDAIVFSVFALHHSLFARASVKARLAGLVSDGLIRSVYVWTASVLLLLVMASWQTIAFDLYVVTGWRAAAHALVQLGGVWLIARSVARIDALELAGIRPPSRRESLQIAGPYRWVRHPLYLGWLLVVFGAAHMTGDRFGFAVITTAYLFVAIPWEERSLRREFGEAYVDYQRRVRSRVIPYVY
jgi:protein-S-isoprenylcysteine O-methyltransferase Ste14